MWSKYFQDKLCSHVPGRLMYICCCRAERFDHEFHPYETASLPPSGPRSPTAALSTAPANACSFPGTPRWKKNNQINSLWVIVINGDGECSLLYHEHKLHWRHALSLWLRPLSGTVYRPTSGRRCLLSNAIWKLTILPPHMRNIATPAPLYLQSSRRSTNSIIIIIIILSVAKM